MTVWLAWLGEEPHSQAFLTRELAIGFLLGHDGWPSGIKRIRPGDPEADVVEVLSGVYDATTPWHTAFPRTYLGRELRHGDEIWVHFGQAVEMEVVDGL